MKRLFFTLAFLFFASEAWAGRSVVQTDNFDDNNMGAGSVIWTQLNSANAIMGNAGGIVIDNHAPEAAVKADGTYANNQYSKLQILSYGTVSSHTIGVICRASTDTGTNRDYYKMMVTGSSPKTTLLGLVVNGTTTTTIASSTAITWAVNDTIEIECDGTAIRGYKNGVSVLSGVEATLTTGKPGIMIINQFSNGDNWEGGDITAGGVSAAPPIRVIMQ